MSDAQFNAAVKSGDVATLATEVVRLDRLNRVLASERWAIIQLVRELCEAQRIPPSLVGAMIQQAMERSHAEEEPE